ncbi:MAG: pentapeptide repeat-containing protein, partial [Sulfurimonas sp.]|nr:pentapeptide repeat-containing protein [Sulfurimonas sp.]
MILLFLSPQYLFSSSIINGYKIEPKANLKGANLQDAELTNAQLQRANLSDANLTNAQLQVADLSYADLRGANLKDADISYTKFIGAKLGGATWVNGLKCRKTSVGFCRYIYKAKKKVVKTHVDFKGQDLSGKTLDNANFVKGDLRGTKFLKSSLVGVNFTKANLMGATFKSAKLQKANFTGANLSGTDFRWANLKDANFKDAILKRTRFEGATWIDGRICGKKSMGVCKSIDMWKFHILTYLANSTALISRITLTLIS